MSDTKNIKDAIKVLETLEGDLKKEMSNAPTTVCKTSGLPSQTLSEKEMQRNVFKILKACAKAEVLETKDVPDSVDKGSGGQTKKGPSLVKEEKQGIPKADVGNTPKAPKPPQAPGAAPTMHKDELEKITPEEMDAQTARMKAANNKLGAGLANRAPVKPPTPGDVSVQSGKLNAAMQNLANVAGAPKMPALSPPKIAAPTLPSAGAPAMPAAKPVSSAPQAISRMANGNMKRSEDTNPVEQPMEKMFGVFDLLNAARRGMGIATGGGGPVKGNQPGSGWQPGTVGGNIARASQPKSIGRLETEFFGEPQTNAPPSVVVDQAALENGTPNQRLGNVKPAVNINRVVSPGSVRPAAQTGGAASVNPQTAFPKVVQSAPRPAVPLNVQAPVTPKPTAPPAGVAPKPNPVTAPRPQATFANLNSGMSFDEGIKMLNQLQQQLTAHKASAASPKASSVPTKPPPSQPVTGPIASKPTAPPKSKVGKK